MIFAPTGATRLHIIIGDPVAQVRSPAGVSEAFADRESDAILVAVQVAPADLADFIATMTRVKNLDGIVATIPHKFACYRACATATERAHFIGAVNLMRRGVNGKWHGDMVDGLGFVGAAQAAGFDPADARALQVGAGGAGSAIALALIDAGVRELAIHDSDPGRRDALIARLNESGKGRAVVGSADANGFDMVVNATPAGMQPGDPLPVDMATVSPSAYCGCVITKPEVSPFITAARDRGCLTATGTDMYHALERVMVDFLLSKEAPS
ncbi:putative Shikimate dehydrogenase [Bradyrhizobium sp. ORS 285]|uniref:shikimate dehydrogenase family protein n=1 Tax=Bradyrhizobium sp. ORS 285 TaxID=115808 RepID=UPI0002405B80|nr:shikimate dehydrogenase [Bradyrhizobium sp. ORS 285]CCD84201.1 putative Shikimate dehydrogenase [Bradyrhizobium sp. ORS 285]SMX55776.1 putative Shikimate dehydrogenase [Bradyrhizobium sp. ORS 285]